MGESGQRSQIDDPVVEEQEILEVDQAGQGSQIGDLVVVEPEDLQLDESGQGGQIDDPVMVEIELLQVGQTGQGRQVGDPIAVERKDLQRFEMLDPLQALYTRLIQRQMRPCPELLRPDLPGRFADGPAHGRFEPGVGESDELGRGRGFGRGHGRCIEGGGPAVVHFEDEYEGPQFIRGEVGERGFGLAQRDQGTGRLSPGEGQPIAVRIGAGPPVQHHRRAGRDLLVGPGPGDGRPVRSETFAHQGHGAQADQFELAGVQAGAVRAETDFQFDRGARQHQQGVGSRLKDGR